MSNFPKNDFRQGYHLHSASSLAGSWELGGGWGGKWSAGKNERFLTLGLILMYYMLPPYLYTKRSEVFIIQSCLALCDPMDWGSADSSVPGILQARILEHVAISFSRRTSQPRDKTQISCITRLFTIWATREAHTNKMHNLFLRMIWRIKWNHF